MQTATSKDGTAISYDSQGEGPLVVLVDGALCYRSFGPMPKLAGLLATRFTIITYDRRGRGGSGETGPVAVEREVEDIEALIDASGGFADLVGFSSGACLCLEAAIRLKSKVRKLAMFEPPYDSRPAAAPNWRTYSRELGDLVAQGRRDDALALFMRFAGTPTREIEVLRESPVWPRLESVAPTLLYDQAAIGEDRAVPSRRAAGVQAPTLVMDGAASSDFMHATAASLAKAIPHARLVTINGHSHNVPPEVLAPLLVGFLGS